MGAAFTPGYEKMTDPVVEFQLGRAGVRLAWLLDGALK